MKLWSYFGRILIVFAAVGFGSGMLIGCEEDGPMENAGEEVDDAADDAEDAVD